MRVAEVARTRPLWVSALVLVVGPAGCTGHVPVQTPTATMGINLDGVAVAMMIEMPAMLQVGGGSIVNIATVEAHTILKEFLE